jgi:hypothetical protein
VKSARVDGHHGQRRNLEAHTHEPEDVIFDIRDLVVEKNDLGHEEKDLAHELQISFMRENISGT